MKLQQRHLAARKADALAVLHREPEFVEPGAIEFLAHALIVPTTDPAERERFDKDVEAIAVQIATAYDESRGATVREVSKPELAELVVSMRNVGSTSTSAVVTAASLLWRSKGACAAVRLSSPTTNGPGMQPAREVLAVCRV